MSCLIYAQRGTNRHLSKQLQKKLEYYKHVLHDLKQQNRNKMRILTGAKRGGNPDVDMSPLRSDDVDWLSDFNSPTVVA
jgi:hypothetical protein